MISVWIIVKNLLKYLILKDLDFRLLMKYIYNWMFNLKY
jgi:hypothetical protein